MPGFSRAGRSDPTPVGMPAAYEIRLDTSRLRALASRARPLDDPESQRRLGDAVRRAGQILQARAVRNVSGYPVVYEGGVFRVMPRTGTLKGAIELQWPYGSVFKARVFVNGTHTNPGRVPGDPRRARSRSVAVYADAIEHGHASIDLKRRMKGKTVPLFGARAQNARGPYAASGLQPANALERGFGSTWHSEKLNQRLAAKGKGPMTFTKRGGRTVHGTGRGTAYFISFRRVGDTGWVIPAAKPRPFMGAATAATSGEIRRLVANTAADLLGGR